MRITLRIYRTHDYDLMALSCSNALRVGAAAKKALVAYYKGDAVHFNSEPMEKLPTRLPPSKTFILSVCEEDAEGIEKWFRRIKVGYRNQFMKDILRYYIGAPNVDLYREDSWVQADSPEDETPDPLAIDMDDINRYRREAETRGDRGDGRQAIRNTGETQGKRMPQGKAVKNTRPSQGSKGSTARGMSTAGTSNRVIGEPVSTGSLIAPPGMGDAAPVRNKDSNEAAHSNETVNDNYGSDLPEGDFDAFDMMLGFHENNFN